MINYKNILEQQLGRDGLSVNVIELKNNHGMTATFMDIGATWLSSQVVVNGKPREMLLGIHSIDDHYRSGACMGATVGRYANRIKNGQISIDGIAHQLVTNQGKHTLHGGDGFHFRRWTIEKVSSSHVTFSLVSEDGDQGFPGEVSVQVTYQLSDDNQLHIDFNATTTKDTYVNLTNHAYFNLSASKQGDALAHQLSINTEYFLPVSNEGIPYGELRAVAKSSFDFRAPKSLASDFMSDEDQNNVKGYDHSFLLKAECLSGEEVAAELVSPEKDVTMQVLTTKPAIQLYTGNYLGGVPKPEGGYYADHAGIALEAQFMPDSPNNPHWPQKSVLLKVGEHYKHSTIYRFLAD